MPWGENVKRFIGKEQRVPTTIPQPTEVDLRAQFMDVSGPARAELYAMHRGLAILDQLPDAESRANVMTFWARHSDCTFKQFKDEE